MNIAGIAVFVVGKFSQEHFINEIVSSCISGDGLLKLLAVPGKHFMQLRRIAFAVKSTGASNSIHLIHVGRAQAEPAHSLCELLFIERKKHGKSVDFLLLAIPQLLILIFHIMRPPFSSAVQIA